jgi:hypothetical protein
MANLILRPDNVGSYNSWPTRFPFQNIWEDINDIDDDGDGSYVGTDNPGAFTCTYTTGTTSDSPLPTRIRGISVVATIRTVLPLISRFKFRIRYFGQDYDSDEIAIASTDYQEQYHEYLLNPFGHGWTSISLKDIQFGLVFVSGDSELRCTKMEAHVHQETFPTATISAELW